jgi:chitinase
MARLGYLGVLACVTALGASALAAPSASAAAPIPEVAPYFETSATHTANLQTAITEHGLASFTAAFVLGDGCKPTWDDSMPITGKDAESKLVKHAITAGASAIVSFGGQQGTELAASCTSKSDLADAYRSVINKFAVTKIDFDIEGAGPLNDSATNKRRYAAIRTLEQRFPDLEVSLTIPVGRAGLNSDPTYGDAVAFLNLAKSTATRIDVVNLMTMNYGGQVGDMGSAATTAAKDAMAQIKAIWPSDSYANLGITPMIGKNDSAHEVFSYADAHTVVTFAHNHGVRRLAFWDLNRDQSCGAGDSPPATCTGVSQQPLDYTDGFLG